MLTVRQTEKRVTTKTVAAVAVLAESVRLTLRQLHKYVLFPVLRLKLCSAPPKRAVLRRQMLAQAVLAATPAIVATVLVALVALVALAVTLAPVAPVALAATVLVLAVLVVLVALVVPAATIVGHAPVGLVAHVPVAPVAPVLVAQVALVARPELPVSQIPMQPKGKARRSA